MKRFGLIVLIFLSWLLLVATAGAQTAVRSGWPPQGVLFKDARFLAQITPFLIALGIVAGIFQARADARAGGDTIVGEKVRRHDTSTLIAHWLNAFGLILGLVSGAIILKWVDYALQFRLAFIIHYVGAALMIFAIFNHLTRHGVRGGTGLIPKKLSVIRDLIGELFEYVGLFGPEGAVLRIPWPKSIRQPIARYVSALLGYRPSHADKYLATEQLISYPVWSILVGVLVVTGLIKVMRYVYPISSAIVGASTALHDITAIAVSIMLLIHLLPLLLVPANWPLLLSMFKGTVPRNYVAGRHATWYHNLEAKAEQAAPAIGEAGPAEGRAADLRETRQETQGSI